MNQDLKTIKKKYGEDMMHFCRENFSSILEQEELLPQLLSENFYPSHVLLEDIQKENLESDFKNYIYNLVDVENNNEIIVNKTPKELLNEAGYDLFECKSEEDIQFFRKYYANGEALCTFNSNRLNTCHVFFAVKKDVENIKREDYKNPQRQDKYGTSVISIQFTKDESHTLSIKNRYNHTVNNPDATFSNNLDYIIPGLTESFEREYGLVQKYKNDTFEITNYTQAEGKYYKFNYEINNTCYCPDNIVIKNFKAKQYEKEKYIVFDYFILDLINKEIIYDKVDDDFFPKTIKEIKKIKIENKKETKEIYITEKEREDVIITLDKENRIIGYKNENILEIGDDFLYWNETLKKISLSNVIEIGESFLDSNESLKKISLPNVEKIGNSFLKWNKKLIEVFLPKVEEIGYNFLYYNETLRKISLPNTKKIDGSFLYRDEKLTELFLPKVEEIGDGFLYLNQALTELFLPNIEKIGNAFLCYNQKLRELSLPNVVKIGDWFLKNNEVLTKINIPENTIIDEEFIEKYKEILNNKKTPPKIKTIKKSIKKS